MHKYVELALASIREYVLKGARLSPPDPLPEEMKRKAGLFVCIKTGGNLRGCIGTIKPYRPNIAEEIIANALSAATRDSRFQPMVKEELDDITVSVDILSISEKVDEMDELDPKIYGLIVSAGERMGILLPDLEGVDTPIQQIAICKRKGNIEENEEVTLERFRVKRYK